MAQLLVSSLLLSRTHSRIVEAAGKTVREAIDDIDRKHPGFRDDLAPNGVVRRSFRLIVDGNLVDDINSPIGEKTTIEVLEQRVGG